jgi:hypothetical protein
MHELITVLVMVGRFGTKIVELNSDVMSCYTEVTVSAHADIDMHIKELFLKSIVFLSTFNSLNLPSQAADSRWLLCDNGKLAMNLLEHRSGDGQGRTTDLILLLGSNIFRGQLANTDLDKVILSSLSQDKSSFRGEVAVNHQKNLVSLKGTLNLSGNLFSIKTQLKCKELRSNL